MASIGSYILSTQQRGRGEPDPQIAAGQCLKLIGERQPRSIVDLVAITGWSQDYVKAIVSALRENGWVAGPDEALELTEPGFRAQFIAAV